MVAPIINALDPSTVATSRSSEDILLAHLIFKCLVKCATWLFHRVKDEHDKAKVTPWVSVLGHLVNLLTDSHSYERSSKTLRFNYGPCPNCESISFSLCVHLNLHLTLSPNKISLFLPATSSFLVNSSEDFNSSTARDLFCCLHAVISYSTTGVKSYKPPMVHPSWLKVMTIYYIHVALFWHPQRLANGGVSCTVSGSGHGDFQGEPSTVGSRP